MAVIVFLILLLFAAAGALGQVISGYLLGGALECGSVCLLLYPVAVSPRVA